jgi:hypothetical protein
MKTIKGKIGLKANKSLPFKRRICIQIGLFLMRIYEKTRGCSGVKIETEKVLKEYENNERIVDVVKEFIPKIKSKADELVDRNRYLEGRVVFMFNELRVIDKLADDADYKEIKMLLSKYDFSKKLEY